jgi:hypothetical protein
MAAHSERKVQSTGVVDFHQIGALQ